MSLHISVDTGCNLACNYCVSPDTKVLMHDLTWKRIDEVQEGERVIAFDYEAKDTRYKMYREADVEAVHRHEALAVDIHTDKGVITAEHNHPFYTKKSKRTAFRGADDLREGDEIYYFTDAVNFKENEDYKQGYIVGAFAGDGSIPGWKEREEYEPSRGLNNREGYVSSIDKEVGEVIIEYSENVFEDIQFSLKDRRYNGNADDSAMMALTNQGDELVEAFAEFEETKDYMRGWLAGMFDTDGTFPKGVNVVFAQYTGDIFDTICDYLDELDYSWTHDQGKRGDFSDMVRVIGGSDETYRLLSEIRPKVERKYKSFIGNNRIGGTATIEKIVERGEQNLYDLTTSESTFIADGFLSRNCYEEEDRTVNGNDVTDNYDMDAIMDRLKEFKERYPQEVPGLHGGEPLLLRDEDIETIFEWVYNNYKEVRNGEKYSHIQTNGTLLRNKHIDIFEKYNVNVGISCDGPPELNRERKAAMREDATERLSGLTYDNIYKLGVSDVPVGIIVVLHETNAGTDEALEKLLDWIDDLNKNGIYGHFNEMLPYEKINQDLALSPERMKEVYIKTWDWMQEESYRSWNPMRDFQDNLLGNSLSDCRVSKCDPFDAGAAKIIDGEGETSGCGKTWAAVGDGTPFLQGPSNNSEYNDDEDRERILKSLPGAPETEGPDLGGCKGCKYWKVCQGGCPSAGIDEDHRNRTRWCESKYYLYKHIEEEMRTMFPNIKLVTDLPWNAETQNLAQSGQLDIGQFDALNSQGNGKKKSAYADYERDKGLPEEMIPSDRLPQRNQEEIVEEFKREHGEENVTVEVEGDKVITHADSDMDKQ